MDMDKFADDVSEMVQQLASETTEWVGADQRTSSDHKIDMNCSRIDVIVLIIEGFLIYNDERINRFFGLRFHLYLSAEVGLQRRMHRTFKHVNPNPKWYWDNYAWVYYQKYLNEVPNKSEMIFLNGEHDAESIFNQAHADLTKFLTSQTE